MAVTTLGGNILLDTLIASGMFLALGVSGSNPTADGTGLIEPALADNYERVDITDYMTAATNKSITNESAIFFTECLNNDWGTITHIALFNARAAGTMYFYAPLDLPVTITLNHVPVFRAGSFIINIS